MTVDKEYINSLLRLYFTNQATHKQREALFSELQKQDNDEEWQDILMALAEETQPQENYDPHYWQQKIREITQSQTRVVQLQTRRRWSQVAAAAILLGLLIGSYFIFFRETKQPSLVKQPVPVVTDLPPGTQGAILTLADGKTIVLDSTFGNIASEGGVAVINKDGQLVYDLSRLPSDDSRLPSHVSRLTYHTMSTPRGRQYQLTLHDGTRVWLNAESSIRFPTAFAGKERIVEITGEAYFEVAHNAAKPFIVSVNDMQVEVLGTHFNINSYADEGLMKTTLLEGKVRVTRNGTIALLNPGQQALASGNAPLTINSDVDVDQVMAWKNGYFSFANADLQTIMRQAARWYDVDVSYEGKVPAVQFTGEIGRTLTLKQFLNILEETRIHYKIEGHKLMITP